MHAQDGGLGVGGFYAIRVQHGISLTQQAEHNPKLEANYAVMMRRDLDNYGVR